MTATSTATRRLPLPLWAAFLFRPPTSVSSLTTPVNRSCKCLPSWPPHAHQSTLPLPAIASAISSSLASPERHALCRAFSSGAASAASADRPTVPARAPLFVVTADGLQDTATPAPPPLPLPESMPIDELLDHLPSVLQSAEPASIFAYYASLFNLHPSALTDPLLVDILNALAPSDTLSCINVFQDWIIRQRSLHGDASSPPSAMPTATPTSPPPVLLAFLSALRHASSPDIFISGINIVVSALENADNHHLRGLSGWWRVLDTVLDMYASDLFPTRMSTAGPLALAILGKAKKAATLPNGRMSPEWDDSWANRCEIRALGQSGDVPTLMARFQDVSSSQLIGDDNVPPHPSEWITAFARAGDFERARSLFITCVQSEIVPSLESAHALLLRAAKSNNLQATLDLQSALFDVYGPDVDDPTHPGVNLYAPLLDACRLALSKHRFARYPHPEDWTHRLYIAKVFQETRAAIAQLGLRMSESMHETALACMVLANYDDHYRYPLKDAAAALEAMIQDGYMPTQYAIHTLMRGYANTRQSINVLERVTVILQYMQIMRACNVPVTAETYSIAFLALNPRKPIVKKRAAVIAKLSELHKEMTQQFGIPHTHQSLHAYMRVMGAHGGWSHLYRAFDGMHDKFGLKPNVTTYFTMMHALQRDPAGAQYAIEVLEPQMRAEGVDLTPDMAHTLLACCVTVNNEAMAWSVFDTMGRLGLPVTHTVLNYLLKMALFNGRIQHAQFVLDEFHRRGMFYDPTTYYHLMTYFAKINPDQDKVHLLIEHLRGQTGVCEQFSLLTGCLTAELAAPAKANTAAAPSLTFNPLPMDLVTELSEPAEMVATRKSQSASAKVHPANSSQADLTIPPLPALPSPDTCHPLQRPIQVLMDSRLLLKELQLHIGNQDYVKAFHAFTSLLCNFHVAMLHRFAMARQYRAEAIADFAAREATAAARTLSDAEVEDTVEAVISRQPMLSYPPRIVHYEPYNNRAGVLYLPKDVATATWLMCQSLLHMPGTKLPADFPLFRYVQLKQPVSAVSPTSDNGSAVWDASDQYLSRISFKSLSVAGMNKVAVARVVFRTSMRALNAILGFPTMVRFDWVKDLMDKLSFDIDYSNRYRVQIRRGGMFSDAGVGSERERQVDPVFSGMPKSVIEQLVWDERRRRDEIKRRKEEAAAVANPSATITSAAERTAAMREDLRTLSSLLHVRLDDRPRRFTRMPFTGASPATLSELMVRPLPEEPPTGMPSASKPSMLASTDKNAKVPEDVLADELAMETEIKMQEDGMDEAGVVRKTMFRDKPRGKLGRPARVSAETALEREGPLDL